MIPGSRDRDLWGHGSLQKITRELRQTGMKEEIFFELLTIFAIFQCQIYEMYCTVNYVFYALFSIPKYFVLYEKYSFILYTEKRPQIVWWMKNRVRINIGVSMRLIYFLSNLKNAFFYLKIWKLIILCLQLCSDGFRVSLILSKWWGENVIDMKWDNIWIVLLVYLRGWEFLFFQSDVLMVLGRQLPPPVANFDDERHNCEGINMKWPSSFSCKMAKMFHLQFCRTYAQYLANSYLF